MRHFLADTGVSDRDRLRLTMPPPLLRLLIVEDDEVLRDTLPLLLESDDRDITVCETAEDGLARHRARPFDVVLTDVTLAGMSGVALAQAVLADAPDTWVVLVSGHALDPAVRAMGPNVHLVQKPFEIARIEALLAERG